jgi:hypothetical protein
MTGTVVGMGAGGGGVLKPLAFAPLRAGALGQPSPRRSGQRCPCRPAAAPARLAGHSRRAAKGRSPPGFRRGLRTSPAPMKRNVSSVREVFFTLRRNGV